MKELPRHHRHPLDHNSMCEKGAGNFTKAFHQEFVCQFRRKIMSQINSRNPKRPNGLFPALDDETEIMSW